MGVLQDIERRRALSKIRGASKPRRKARGPRFSQLGAAEQAALRDYANAAGPYWRSALLSACLRGRSTHMRFESVLCPLVKTHGPRWLRDLSLPREPRRG